MHRLNYMLIQAAILAFSTPALGEDFELNARQFEGIVYSKFTWTVHLKGTELKIERPGKKSKVKRIKPGDIETLRRTLDQNGFTSLRSAYGCTQCNDTGGCWLEVSPGFRKKSVSVLPYLGLSGPNQQDAADIRRFMEVWRMLKQIAGLSGVKDMCSGQPR